MFVSCVVRADGLFLPVSPAISSSCLVDREEASPWFCCASKGQVVLDHSLVEVICLPPLPVLKVLWKDDDMLRTCQVRSGLAAKYFSSRLRVTVGCLFFS